MNDTAELVELLREQFSLEKKKPLYILFTDVVKQAIQSGLLKQGEFLPSEREFSQLLNISRITVRKALERLEEQSLIVRSRGQGTYVNNSLEYSLKTPQGFSQQLILRGKKPNTIWVNKTLVSCSDEVASHLNLESGSDVFMLKRVRYADDDPVSVEESYVPVELIHDIDQIGLSLYDYFHSQHIFPHRTKSWVNARMSDEAFQAHIKLDKMMPILLIKQVVFDNQGNPIEYSINYCRSDMYTFVSEE